MPVPLVINDTDDANHLNRDSLLFARYFCCIIIRYSILVNNYEIKCLYKRYVDLILYNLIAIIILIENMVLVVHLKQL